MIKQTLLALAAVGACLTPSAALAEEWESGATEYVRGARVEMAWTDQGEHGPILIVVERRSYHTAFAGHCMGRGDWDWIAYGDTELTDEFKPWVEDYFGSFC